ncbi:hypothetical protein [Escherichia coli]|uniref:hypothetical protein n=1 Tax=Escherichia coli TaxID=562 RepID=UPI0016539424|nr:hypothetical protein [Escherichia coli]
MTEKDIPHDGWIKQTTKIHDTHKKHQNLKPDQPKSIKDTENPKPDSRIRKPISFKPDIKTPWDISKHLADPQIQASKKKSKGRHNGERKQHYMSGILKNHFSDGGKNHGI